MPFRLFSFKSRKADDDCRVVADLHLNDGIMLHGMIMKIGSGVVLFREASAFIMVRDGVAARVVFEGGEIEGVISRTTPEGYLIQASAERFAA
jgi:hypothetical protein